MSFSTIRLGQLVFYRSSPYAVTALWPDCGRVSIYNGARSLAVYPRHLRPVLA